MNGVHSTDCEWRFMSNSNRDSSEPSDDALLLRDVQDGKQEAARVLFQKYRQLVYMIAYRFVRNPTDVADIVQQTFIAAFSQSHTFQGKSKLSTWLGRIAVNLSLNHQKQSARRETVPLDECNPENLDDGTTDPSQELATRERHDQLRQAVDSLSPNHRAIIALHDLQGHSYEEISEILRCPMGTVMSRLYYARNALREKLVDVHRQ